MNTINRRIKNFLKSPLLIYKCSNSIGSRAASCSKAKYDGNDLIEILRSARFRIIAHLKSFILRLLRLKIHLRAATGQLLNLSFIVPPDKIQVTTKDNRQNKRDLPSRSLFKIIRVVILDRSQGIETRERAWCLGRSQQAGTNQFRVGFGEVRSKKLSSPRVAGLFSCMKIYLVKIFYSAN